MPETAWPDEFAERYRAAGYWTGETFGELLAARAAEHAERVAVVDGDLRLTYRELDERANELAAGFVDAGLVRGDRVVLQLPNIAEFVEIVFALFRIGALPVYALPAHRRTELRHIAEQTGAVAMITVAEHDGFAAAAAAAEIAAELPAVRLRMVVRGESGPGAMALHELRARPRPLPGPAASDVAFLQLSGGTTGLPKLIPRTHDDYLYSVRESARICALDTGTVYLVALPVAHNFPMSSPGFLGVLYAGGRIVMCPRPDPDTAFALIAAEGVTITGVVPPVAAVWAQAAPSSRHDLSSLDVLQVGGAKCSVELARRIGPALGARLQQVFGMAEGLVNYTRLDDPDELVLHTQGRPISAADELRVVDPADRDVPAGTAGALLTRGPYTIRGYWAPEGEAGAGVRAHNAETFTVDGFYRTGDLVRLTPDGYLVVSGRVKEQINRGGEKVAAEEIENHLLAHPAVLDAAVVAMPDTYLGERTCAYVRPVPGVEPPTGSQLRAFVRSRGVAAFVVPDRVQVVAEFPATGVGKVSKRELRAAITAQLRASAS
ncbi:(2,3-dihydroxybenzoyl)adenylate synthase [Pseudonocardia sp. TRM90224]|uniref:(2,3-dihydroxybenzoyl)adenylate synthase n=1 Tax=Pseudonocardia sp. TRM90224 TaxID=2812678 RepID=UPI001E5D11B3|nr:AMP-binding protein [Pseudonocardia sp. TRM90224]